MSSLEIKLGHWITKGGNQATVFEALTTFPNHYVGLCLHYTSNTIVVWDSNGRANTFWLDDLAEFVSEDVWNSPINDEDYV